MRLEDYTATQPNTTISRDNASNVTLVDGGFRRHQRVKNFFTDHYDHPIYEGGVQLVDIVYLQREL